MLSLSSHCLTVNHPAPWPALAVGTPPAGVACSKGVNPGSCPIVPRHASVARPANTPPDAGGAGTPVNVTGPPPTANNAARTKPDAIAAADNSARLVPSRRLHPLKSSPSHRWSRRSHHPRPTRRPRPRQPARASAQTEFRKKPGACPAIAQAATSCSSPRLVPRRSTSVPAPVARRYDASDSGKPGSAAGVGAVAGHYAAVIVDRRLLLHSCRHMPRFPFSDYYRFIAPKDRGGSGWTGRSGPPFPLSARGPL